MPITRMDHFNIITDDLPATLAFYEEHLNLKPGARPPFKFSGAWLYADGGKGKDPILHVVAGKERKLLVKGVIDHMAFYGTGLAQSVAKLKAKGIDYELRRLPEYGTWQL
ncbi:MAG: VOC family protein, partial [Burkholderiales bacterium]